MSCPMDIRLSRPFLLLIRLLQLKSLCQLSNKILGHFTLARLRVQLRKFWAESEPSLSWAFRVNKVQLRFSVQAWDFWAELQDVHTCGSARARLGIRAEPRAEPVWIAPLWLFYPNPIGWHYIGLANSIFHNNYNRLLNVPQVNVGSIMITSYDFFFAG